MMIVVAETSMVCIYAVNLWCVYIYIYVYISPCVYTDGSMLRTSPGVCAELLRQPCGAGGAGAARAHNDEVEGPAVEL